MINQKYGPGQNYHFKNILFLKFSFKPVSWTEDMGWQTHIQEGLTKNPKIEIVIHNSHINL